MDSMTGYAFIEAKTKQFSFSLELKTLNSKFVEIYVNVPRVIRYEETQMQTLLKEYFTRGKIEMNIDIYDWISEREISVNHELLKKYYNEFEKARSELKAEKGISLDALLGIDGVVTKARSVVSDESLQTIYATIEKAIKKTEAMRKKEGGSIEKDLASSLKVITDSATKIEKLTKSSSKLKFERLTKKLEAFTGTKVDETRLYTEVALLADRLDINEEISRLKDHAVKFKATVKEKGQVGKKLDFIAQELFRETNTIGSKVNNAQVAHLVVEMKNNIDKIREQCRNVV